MGAGIAWVGEGDFVGVLASRSLETIAGLLAVLNCGAAFVPLDPAYPSERLGMMLQDCAPKVVLVDGAFVDLACALPIGCQVTLAVDRRGDDRKAFPRAHLSSGSPAYIIYTSGSTGRPKGVIVPHKGIVNLCRDQNFFTMGASQTHLHMAPMSSDVSQHEIWMPLLNGGRCAVLEMANPSLSMIADALVRHNVTMAGMTPGIFHLLVDHHLEALGSVAQVVCGGDVVSPGHVKALRAAYPDKSFRNVYGPTENSVISSSFFVPTDWDGAAVPIGKAVSRCGMAIVDNSRQPVVDGEMGELAVTGAGLAIGYLNRPEETARKFVLLDLGDETPTRAYLTGDLARRRPDGVFEFCGRADRQIKVMGRRIELDDVENALRADSHVADAAALAVADRSAGKRIVGFVRPACAAAADFSDKLRARLLRTIPEFMVPNDIEVVESFPLTPGRKVDRDALGAALAARQASESDRRTEAEQGAESSSVEALIADVWREVLQCREIRPDQTFFDLGGRSLQMMEAHAALQKRLGRSFDIVLMFRHPLIHDLAAAIEGLVREPATQLLRRVSASIPNGPRAEKTSRLQSVRRAR
ncbi:MAG: non-ribosomal peptide synthetase [Pseudomonadota bacterium]